MADIQSNRQTEYSPASIAHLPPQAQPLFTNTLDVYNDSPHLSGMVCVALATGLGKCALRGRYFDVGQDLEDVLAQAAALRDDRDLYALHTRFLGGLANDGVPPPLPTGGDGAEKEEGDGRFVFPGF
jgi:hypothetical protein